MKNITIKPAENLKGQITVPGDKSISHRSVMLGSLAEGETHIKNFLMGEDCLSTLKAFSEMGIQTEAKDDGTVTIYGKGLGGLKEPSDVLDVGNSGTSIRIMSGILAGQPFYSVITGDESIRGRPMGRITQPLQQMGAQIYGRERGQKAPLTIIGGNLKAIRYETPVASAQVKSSILLAGLFADGDTIVTEPSPSRDHTERMLQFFGADIQKDGLTCRVKNRQRLKAQEITVCGDISSAAYFIVAALISRGSEIVLKDIGVNPTRTGILEALKMMGAQIQVENEREVSGEPIADISVAYSQLHGSTFNGDLIVKMIDEIPLIAVAATQAEGETVIKDAKELRVKETDRISAIAEGLQKMGAKVKELPDGLVIPGNQWLRGTTCKSHFDHRIAMSMAVAALVAEGETTIEDVECVDTSFPGFWKMLEL